MKIIKELQKDISLLSRTICGCLIAPNYFTTPKFKTKFKGKYHNKNINNNEKYINDFIDQGLYYHDEIFQKDFDKNTINQFINFKFGEPYLYDQVLYNFRFDELFNEIFLLVNHAIKTNPSLVYSYESLCNKISLSLEGFVTAKNKIDFLETLIQNIYCKIKPHNEFLLFTKNHERHSQWEDYISELFEFDNSDFEVFYLTSDVNYDISKTLFFKEGLYNWIYFHQTTNILSFIKNKIIEINTENKSAKKTNKKPTSSELNIFKKEGLLMFNCIVENYDKEKNKAFFSYLFHYLNQKNQLKIYNSTSSKDFINYIDKRFNLKMSRVIKSNSEVEYKKEKIFIQFEDILTHYLDE